MIFRLEQVGIADSFSPLPLQKKEEQPCQKVVPPLKDSKLHIVMHIHLSGSSLEPLSDPFRLGPVRQSESPPCQF